MIRVSSALVFSMFILGSAALPACTATALDDEACAEACDDADDAVDDGAQSDDAARAPGVTSPGLRASGIVVPQNPKGPGGGE